MTKHPKTAQGDHEAELGFYHSRTPTIETDVQSFNMFCPSCQRMQTQITSFRTDDFSHDDRGSIPCIRCAKCKLIYDSPLYKKEMAALKAKGFHFPR